MKKLMVMLLVTVLVLGCFCGCSGGTKPPEILVTIFPLYDFARVILGDNPAGLELGLLEKNGTDLHNFQPSAEDIALIGAAKLFAYIGGESDEWVEDALTSSPVAGRVCRMMDAVKTLGEETVEGMQPAEEEEEEEAPDEHIWLSLTNAQQMVQQLCEEICSIDSANETTYRANAAAYVDKLEKLAQEYQDTVKTASFDTILVADRFPFRYLASEYGLNYYAAFSGCAASLDVSFETVAFLSEKLKELGLPAVIIIDGSDGSVAQTVVDSSGMDVKILTLHSCQCVSKEELDSGIGYYEIMISNLAILKEALNE